MDSAWICRQSPFPGDDPYGLEMQEDRKYFQWLGDVAEKTALGELEAWQMLFIENGSFQIR